VPREKARPNRESDEGVKILPHGRDRDLEEPSMSILGDRVLADLLEKPSINSTFAMY
jgi:hypothetical protein